MLSSLARRSLQRRCAFSLREVVATASTAGTPPPPPQEPTALKEAWADHIEDGGFPPRPARHPDGSLNEPGTCRAPAPGIQRLSLQVRFAGALVLVGFFG